MKTLSNPLVHRLILFVGVVLTIWGCDNVPQKSVNQNEGGGDASVNKEIDSLYDVAWDLKSNYPDSAKKIGEIMIEKSNESNYLQGYANAYNLIGGIYFSKGMHDEAIKNYYLCLSYFEKMSDSTKSKIGIAKVSINIGLIFAEQKNYTKASDLYSKALKFFEKNKDSIKIFSIYTKLGIIFDDQEKYDKALEFYLKSLKIAEKINNKSKISVSYNNIGNIHRKQGNYGEALDYFSEALIIAKKMDSKEDIARLLMNVGITNKDQKKFQQALIKVNEGLKISRKIGNKKLIKENCLILSQIYDGMNDCSKAYNYYQLYSEMNDSILNQESVRQVAEANVIHETDKKEKKIVVLNKDKEVKEVQIGKQRLVIFFSIAGVMIVLFGLFFILRAYKREQKAKRVTTIQKERIEFQRDQLSQKNKQIEEHEKEMTDSIDYAKYIQQAIMPTNEEIYSALPNSFVFFKPKDIVSGDFVWFHKDGNDVFIATADCTGHGVPGAMVSVVCNNALNRSVREFGITEPAKILDKAKEIVLETFARSGGDVKDGMDIALVKLNIGNNILHYAGANRPLWIVRKGANEIEESKATKMPVGKSDRTEGFDGYEFKLNPGDTFYLSSDGYADQFGGADGKKFMTKQFKNILLSMQDKSMKEQGEIVARTIEEWKHPNTGIVYEQVDDNAVIGVRV